VEDCFIGRRPSGDPETDETAHQPKAELYVRLSFFEARRRAALLPTLSAGDKRPRPTSMALAIQ
jgi:hypothetical protein